MLRCKLVIIIKVQYLPLFLFSHYSKLWANEIFRPTLWPTILLSVYSSICLFFYLSILLSVYSSICLFFYLSILLSVYSSICLFFYLSILLFVYYSICLFFYLSILIIKKCSYHVTSFSIVEKK